MSDHADTIRRYITSPLPDFEDGALAALDALVAENQRLRDELGWLLDEHPAEHNGARSEDRIRVDPRCFGRYTVTELSTGSSTGVDNLLLEIARLRALNRRNQLRANKLRQSRDNWKARALRQGL